MKKFQHKPCSINKGLVQKVLDFYFLYTSIQLPFKIGDEYELHEFDLEYSFVQNEPMYDTYIFAENFNHSYIGFIKKTAVLNFYWDVLVDFELEFIKPVNRSNTKSVGVIIDEVLKEEKLFVTENKNSIILKYLVGLDGIELTVTK